MQRRATTLERDRVWGGGARPHKILVLNNFIQKRLATESTVIGRHDRNL